LCYWALEWYTAHGHRALFFINIWALTIFHMNCFTSIHIQYAIRICYSLKAYHFVHFSKQHIYWLYFLTFNCPFHMTIMYNMTITSISIGPSRPYPNEHHIHVHITITSISVWPSRPCPYNHRVHIVYIRAECSC
jgi:hypothetical protein